MWVIFTMGKNWGFVYIFEPLSSYLLCVLYIQNPEMSIARLKNKELMFYSSAHV